MSDLSNERKQLLITAAQMYYIENQSQQQIADALHMSRSNVSLLLKSCTENGIIEIIINDTIMCAHDIALALKQKYGLKNVFIAQSFPDSDQTIQSVARLTAHYLEEILRNKMLLGYTNDVICYNVAKRMFFSKFMKVDSIQMMGGTSSRFSNFDGQELAYLFKEKLRGDSYKLHAPLIVKSPALKQLLSSEPLIKAVMSKYPSIDIAILNIEKSHVSEPHYEQNGVYSKADMLQLSEMSVKSRFLGRFLDKNGKPCNAGINERIMAIDLELLKKIPTVIGISADSVNATAVHSCARSGFINSLIVDEALAKALIEL